MWLFSVLSVLLVWTFQQWSRVAEPRMGSSMAATFRLPADAVPVHYDLTVLTDLDGLYFQGAVNVSLHMAHDTKQLSFHAGPNLDVSPIAVIASQTLTFRAHLHRDAQHADRMSFQTPHTLRAGTNVSMLVGFRAPLTPSMMGYYSAEWSLHDEHGHYALTQFEPKAARLAFPCWDEPDHKATFRVRMLHREHTTALGNMPSTQSRAVSAQTVLDALQPRRLQFTQPELGAAVWLQTDFATTPRMSTYLVAFANGRFEHVRSAYTSPLSNDSIPLRVYTTPEYIERGSYILDVLRHVMPFYERAFDIAYPLPKLDMLTARGFDSEAMENWGLITGRTTTFLIDLAQSSREAIDTATRIVGHECAHMWFGDIATMAWWDNLWLNEAFATYMGEVACMSDVYHGPDWAGEFVHTETNRALDLDAKRSSHPIEMPLEGENVEDAISQVFDAISYSKGASVLRMLSSMLGQDTFFRGVSLYLKHHLYGNTHSSDLWDGLSEASGVNVSTFMMDWTQQQGFPLLTVTEGDGTAHIRQSRFIETGDAHPDEDTTLWHVPLALRTIHHGHVHTDFRTTLPAERAMEVTVPEGAVWKLNADQVGFYRVAYPTEHLHRLIAAKDLLTSYDKLGLVSDSLRLAMAGYASTSNALDLLVGLRNDSSAQVERSMAETIAQLQSMCWEQSPALQEALQRLGADVFGPLAHTLLRPHDPAAASESRLLRAFVIEAAADNGDRTTLAWLLAAFDSVRRGVRPADPDLQAAILKQGVMHGGVEAYDAVHHVYATATDPEYKIAALLALCYAQDAALIDRTIEFVFSDQVMRQDLIHVFKALSANRASRRALWTAVKARMNELLHDFSGNLTLVRLIVAMLSTFTSDADAADMEQFFARLHTSQFHMGLMQALEAIHAQSQWLDRDLGALAKWLQAHGYM